MDLGAAVRFLYDNNELILGVSLVLFLILTVLILIRSVLEGRAAAQEADATPALNVDQLNSALEQALNKALKQDRLRPRPIEGEEGATDEAYVDSELQAALEEKEAKIEALLADLDVLKRQIEASVANVAPAAQGGVAVSGGDPADAEEMKKQNSLSMSCSRRIFRMSQTLRKRTLVSKPNSINFARHLKLRKLKCSPLKPQSPRPLLCRLRHPLLLCQRPRLHLRPRFSWTRLMM
jgi:hypothetical protein